MSAGVIGANGFIGAYLTKYLLARKAFPLRLFVRTMSSQWDNGDAEIFCGDLLSQVDCERFARDLDTIYYLAHTNSPVNSDRDWPSDALNNLVPLLNLLAAIRNLKTRPHIVYFSSGGAVYSQKADRTPYTEADACAPLSSYGIQKLAAEQYLDLAAKQGHLTATALRIGNAYGTQLPGHRMQGLIGVAIKNILHGKPVRIFGNPDNVRDYIHLEDICAIAEKVSRPRRAYDVLNVGTSIGYSVADVLRIIESCYGDRIQIGVENVDAQMLIDWVVLDNTKARREFGWSPLVDLTSGINEMLIGDREKYKLRVGATLC
jgi:UDP-glucose 4-epimerase